MLEAGYFMPKQAFFNNIGTILTYAVLGTLFNAFATGISIWAVNKAGLMPGLDDPYDTSLGMLESLLFGSGKVVKSFLVKQIDFCNRE